MIQRLSMLRLRTPAAHANPAYRFCSDDDFKKQAKVQVTNENAQQVIQKWVSDYDILLFMKGSPQAPRCGFSKKVVELLKLNGIFQYKHVNILEEPIIREQVKIFSKWPTYPQLFIKSELVGGCDIVTEMHKDGSLRKLLEKHNLI